MNKIRNEIENNNLPPPPPLEVISNLEINFTMLIFVYVRQSDSSYKNVILAALFNIYGYETLHRTVTVHNFSM